MADADLMLVLDAARAQALRLEWEAENPHAILSAETPTAGVSAWARKRHEAAATIRQAADRIERNRRENER